MGCVGFEPTPDGSGARNRSHLTNIPQAETDAPRFELGSTERQSAMLADYTTRPYDALGEGFEPSRAEAQ
jgi:hypothetical protein